MLIIGDANQTSVNVQSRPLTGCVDVPQSRQHKQLLKLPGNMTANHTKLTHADEAKI